MMLGAGCGARPRIGEQQDPVRGYKHLADDDILAAGPGKAADKPVIDDLAITDRQQEEGTLEGLPRTPIRGRIGIRGRDEGTELDPARSVASAGERPGAAQHISAVDRDSLAGGSKARAGEWLRVPIPDLALGFDREVGDRSAVGDRAVHRPAGRGAGRRDRHRDLERDLAIIFEAAELLRPTGAQQLGIPDLVDDVGEHIAIALGLLGELPNFRHHAARPADQLLRGRNGEAAYRGSIHLGKPLVFVPYRPPKMRLGEYRDNAKNSVWGGIWYGMRHATRSDPHREADQP